jgi:WD40 repeat protein/serine/threonine protein kinase
MTKKEAISTTRLASVPAAMERTVPAGAAEADEAVLQQAEAAVAFEWKPGDVILDLYEVRSVTEGFGEEAQEKDYHEGGFGRVYKVWHRTWRLEMAVKTPRAETFASQEQKETFIRECETWINLGLHPHIAACHYVRELGGVPRVFSEYAPAGTLEEWIRSGRLYEGDERAALAQILDVGIQLAWGLHYAHERGVIHQDVKPLNALLWDDGTLKVTDYGLAGARLKAGLPRISGGMQTVMVSMGGMTPSHCSPEQAAGEMLDRRTDVWSWAVSVLQMFQGGVTWQTGSLAAGALEAFLKHGGKEEGIPGMQADVADLLRWCFRSNPADRPRTLDDCAKALGAAYEGASGKAYCRAKPRGASDTPDALNNRALSFIDLGKLEDAEKLFERALQLDKHHLAATYNRGLMQWRGGEIADTDLFRNLEEIRTDHPDDASVECVLGWTRMENTDVVQAQVHFERAIKLGDHGEAERGLEEARRLSQSVTANPRTFADHENGVHSAAFSRDGRYIITGSRDKNLRLWDVATGKCLRILEGGGSLVAYSPDGRLALSVGYEKYKTTGLRLWDLATGQCLCIHGIGADPIAFSPDGRFALSGAEDNTLRLWDVAGGQCLRTFEGHKKKINAVAFSPDGRFALSGNEAKSEVRPEEGTLCLWDVTTGRCVRTFEEGARCVAFSPDGRYALSAAWRRPLLLWDVTTGRRLHTFEGETDTIHSIAFSPDGRYALSGGWDGMLRLWDVAERRCLRTFEGYEMVVGAVAFSPNGRFALAGSFDQTISGELQKFSGKLRLWDLSLLSGGRTVSPWLYSIAITAEEALERERTHYSHLSGARQALEGGHIGEALASLILARGVPGFERSHESLELQARAGARCRIKSYSGGWLKRSFQGHTHSVKCVAFSRDGRFVLSGSSQEIRVTDVATGQCLRTVEIQPDVNCSMAFSSDCRFALSGTYALVNLIGKEETPLLLQLWDVATGKCLRTLHGHEPIAISPDGRFALCGRGEKVDGPKPYAIHLSRFLLWDLHTEQCLHTFEGDKYRDGVDTLTFSPDGRFVLSGSNDNKLRMWDIATRECLRTFEGHTDWVKSVAFSPDGRFALSGSNDKTLRLWDVLTKQCRRSFEGHTDSVESVAFSPDGRFALSGSSDKTIRLWDVATGQCLRNFEDGSAPVAFSPDGRYALSGGSENTVRLWEIDWVYEYDPKHDPVLRLKPSA